MTKKCSKCNEIKGLEFFSKEPTPSNPEYRRADCSQCRNKQRRDRQKETGYWKKRYQSMSPEEKKDYIKKRSAQNKKRIKEKPGERERRIRYNNSDKGIFSRYTSDCNRRGRKLRGIEMLLNFEEFKDLINNNCRYCNIENCRGIDRVDSSKSYTKENCVSCCKVCNQMKNNMKIDDFINHIKKIAELHNV